MLRRYQRREGGIEKESMGLEGGWRERGEEVWRENRERRGEHGKKGG